MKVNLGCGHSYIDGWINVDANPAVRADIYLDAFEFVREYGPEVDELYMGHFLEHLLPASAAALLSLVGSRLPEGAVVSAVVPDMRAIFAAYDAGEITNAELNERFIYSYSQPSRHVWCYDGEALLRVFEDAGFLEAEVIDPLTWEPVFWKDGPESRWQCGVRATVPAPGGVRVPPSLVPDEESEVADAVFSADEVLLRRIGELRAEVEALRASAGSDSAEPFDEPSIFDRLPAPIVPAARAVLAEGSPQRAVARFGIDALRATRSYVDTLHHEWARVGLHEARHPRYSTWRRASAPSRRLLAAQRTLSRRAEQPIRIECIVVGRRRGKVERTLASIVAQSWAHWQVTAIGNARIGDAVAALGDARIAFTGANDDGVWSAAQATLDHSPSRDFVVFVEAGDVVAPDCFFEVATRAARDPYIDLVYWDDDVFDPVVGGKDPQFRPAWSPDLLLSTNYIGRAFAVRHRRLMASGGAPGGLGDARYWDFVLRCGLRAREVTRVPQVLAHVGRRLRPDARDAVTAVSNHLGRGDSAATARFERGAVHVVWPGGLTPTVSVIIPTRHNRPLISRCLASLRTTDYPAFEVIVVDNGGRSDDNERWYAESFGDLDLRVEWWTQPFNYSVVNNHAAALAKGEVLLFLNDDTEVSDAGWLRELAGWAMQPGVGLAGAQLIGPEGAIQHGGVILGLNGFADHLFEGMAPDSPSLLGPTTSYRNVLSVTAACVAVRRALFEGLGGFDERFELCGSDVALGIDSVIAGHRNVCTPFAGVRHLESATRGTDVPLGDFFTSYWRYQRWVSGGDPYFSPNLSLAEREPALRSKHERTAADRMSTTLGREIKVFRMQSDASEAVMLASTFRITDADARVVRAVHDTNRAPRAPKTVNWFLPDIDSPFYGGINTVLRLADHLARINGVESRFVFWAAPNEPFFRSAIAAAFPALAHAPIEFHDTTRPSLERVTPADAAVATLWATAYSVAQFPHAARRFYMIQDFEPMFYPAGTLYALAEESYRLGLYGICNTEHMLELYEKRYGGRGMSFQPAVDASVFHAEGRVFERTLQEPATVFVYARPGHWRNCWELASIALEELKARLGDRVRIITAGSWARPEDLGSGIEHLGLLDYRETGNLYRQCDVGVALTVSEHPSYLPLELMACGVPVVAFDNPAGYWALRDGENALLARRTADALSDAMERIVLDPELGRELSRNGLRTIAENHPSWDKAFSGVHEFLSDPERLSSH